VGAEGVAALLRQGGAERESCALGAPPLPTALLSHPSCLLHTAATGSLVQKLSMYDEAQIFNQPENASRLLVLLSPAGLLRTAPFDQLSWRTAPRVPMADLLRVHEYKYVAEIASRCEKLKASEQLRGKLDADTELTPYSFEAALHAAGAAVEATRAVCSAHQRTARNAFCATRPPGHHAGPSGAVGEQSAGFCLFSNAAIAAAYALHVHREVVGKVAVVDFDVHHGNGTEACVQAVVPTTWSESYATAAGTVSVSGTRYKPWLGVGDTSNVFFASIHGFGGEEEEVSSPFYPGSGGPDTNMEMPIIRNKPMPLKSSSARWRRAMMHSLLQPLSQFKPDLIVISAGFDAHAHDPLDAGGLHERDYEWMTSELVAIAETLCEGRLVSVLEGGYRVTGGFCASLARAVGAHVSAMQQTSLVGCQWKFADAAARLERVIGEEQAWEETRRASLEADGHTEGTDAPVPLQENGAPARRGKRSRKEVDYEALQAELDGNPSGD